MRAVLLAVAILASGCGLSVDSVVLQPSPSQAVSAAPSATEAVDGRLSGAGPDREPNDLPRYPEEAAVIDALASAGFRVERIAVSKFEDHIFGERKRARVFYRNYGDHPFRVDVLFLDSPPGDIRICPLRPYGYEYSILIDKRPAIVGATSEIFFAVSDRFFVIASPRAAHESLVAWLNLAVPSC